MWTEPRWMPIRINPATFVDRAGALIEKLEADIAALLEKAEQLDGS